MTMDREDQRAVDNLDETEDTPRDSMTLLSRAGNGNALEVERMPDPDIRLMLRMRDTGRYVPDGDGGNSNR